MIKYISTRGLAPTLGFFDVTLAGLARDGGLYVPENIPQLSADDLKHLRLASYLDVAEHVLWHFVREDLSRAELKDILLQSYKTFTQAEIAPLHRLHDQHYLLELFHGPTLAFKDVALQFLGQVFEFILKKRQQKITIIGATSGDTGSAAIDACKGRDNINIFILHPYERVSEVQRRQMTTVDAPNVFNLAIGGSFDDCQDIVKAMFNDQLFRDRINMSAINSINWARIMAQVVYYVYASLRLNHKTGKRITFSVPTGNFGNVYAGYIAKMMGAPIDKLIVATNRNDILHRFYISGEMRIDEVTPSLSPSMDIQVSSNFERLLFEIYDRDSQAVAETMQRFRAEGVFKLDALKLEKLRTIFASGHKTDAETLTIMRDVYQKYRYVLDPHTAVGVGVAEDYLQQHQDAIVVSLATAHPAKFPAAVQQAISIDPILPAHLKGLYDRVEKYDKLPVNLPFIQDYVLNKLLKQTV